MGGFGGSLRDISIGRASGSPGRKQLHEENGPSGSRTRAASDAWWRKAGPWPAAAGHASPVSTCRVHARDLRLRGQQRSARASAGPGILAPAGREPGLGGHGPRFARGRARSHGGTRREPPRPAPDHVDGRVRQAAAGMSWQQSVAVARRCQPGPPRHAAGRLPARGTAKSRSKSGSSLVRGVHYLPSLSFSTCCRASVSRGVRLQRMPA